MLAQGGSLTGIAAAREGVFALRSYAWLIALLTVVGMGVGYLAAGSSGGASHRVWITVQALGGNTSVTSLGISTPQGPQAADFLNDGVMARVVASTGHDYAYLLDRLELTQPPDGGPNPPIALIANADSQRQARALLRAWLVAIHEARRHYVRGVLSRGERGLRKSLDRVASRGEPVTARDIRELLARMQALRATLNVDYAISKNPSAVAKSPVSRPRDGALGAGTGLVVGFALALLLSLLGGRLRTAEGVRAAVGIDLLVDLRSGREIPSPDHARERLRSLGSGHLPSVLLLVPCGSVPPGAAARLSETLGEGTEVRVTEPLGASGILGELERADACAIVASPGAVRRAEATALRAELDGTGIDPAGLVIV